MPVEPTEPAVAWFASHELRTPLQAIKGGVELLLEERGAGLSALHLEAVGLIAAAAGELERAVAQLAELTELAATATAEPASTLRLDAFLRLPEISRRLAPSERLLAAAGDLAVIVAPLLAARGLDSLVNTAGSSREQPLACDLAGIEHGAVAMTLAFDAPSSGDGTIALRLAAALLQQSGAALRSSGTTSTLLTLRRACPTTT